MKLTHKKDIFLIAGLLLLAGGFFLWQQLNTQQYDSIYAAIRLDGDIVKMIPLDQDTEFVLNQRPNVRFQIKNGQAAFICSDCLDQICVRTGFLGRVGQTSACLPNGLVLYIRGQQADDVDIFI